jgi:hypothetical protein
LAAGDARLQPALARLKKDADKALKAKPESVVNKDAVPPSGDKHDYMSLAPYYWPDPNKPDGLPYINKDGQFNPERKTVPDSNVMQRTARNVDTLALAYYFTANEAYAEHAALLLRTWFLDPATKMNPNLNFAQAIKGSKDGRGAGIIDSIHLIRVVDAAGLLAGSNAWTAQDQSGLAAWFAAFADWLVTSKNGRDEAKNTNNHGVWYDAQLCAYALFAGNEDLARKTIEAAKLGRIDAQIKADGSMPRELARTRSWHYTLFNLEALFALAAIGDRVGIDLWNYRGPGGGSIRKALDFVAPYADPEKKWPYQQLEESSEYTLAPFLRNAALIYGEGRYEELRAKLKLEDAEARRDGLVPGRP